MVWLGPILDLKLISLFYFSAAVIADNMKLLKHKKLGEIVFQQSEHSIYKIYTVSVSMDLPSMKKHSVLNPPEKSKIPTKYKISF